MRNQLTPQLYEIFYALASLRKKGIMEATFSEINAEINERRKIENLESLLPQYLNYHLKKLLQFPFVIKKKRKYALKNGCYKIRQMPPICLEISGERIILEICEEVGRCKGRPYRMGCKLAKRILDAVRYTL